MLHLDKFGAEVVWIRIKIHYYYVLYFPSVRPFLMRRFYPPSHSSAGFLCSFGAWFCLPMMPCCYPVRVQTSAWVHQRSRRAANRRQPLGSPAITCCDKKQMMGFSAGFKPFHTDEGAVGDALLISLCNQMIGNIIVWLYFKTKWKKEKESG